VPVCHGYVLAQHVHHPRIASSGITFACAPRYDLGREVEARPTQCFCDGLHGWLSTATKVELAVADVENGVVHGASGLSLLEKLEVSRASWTGEDPPHAGPLPLPLSWATGCALDTPVVQDTLHRRVGGGEHASEASHVCLGLVGYLPVFDDQLLRALAEDIA